MADFRTQLETAVLLPKDKSVVYPEQYKVPYELINLLYLIRNHYYKYATTLYLFTNPTPSLYASLMSNTLVGQVESYFTSPDKFPSDKAIAQKYLSDKFITQSLYDFLRITTMGYIPNGSTVKPSKFLGLENEQTPIVNRVNSISSSQKFLRGGVYVQGLMPPAWWNEINGTEVVSNDTIPTGNQVISIINSVLESAYKYYSDAPNASEKRTKNSWIKTLMPESRFRTYLKVFTDGRITLEYLKKIEVQDRILAVDKGKDFPLFPNFLVLSGDTKPDPYDSAYLRIDSTSIKRGLADTISYITNQLFAQDINLLNTIGERFKKSVDNNLMAKAKLQEEKDKLDKIDKDLQASIIEAKKIFTTYEILMKNLANKPDPVVAYQQELDVKMDKELATYQAEQQKRLNNEIQAKKEAELKSQIAKQQAEDQARFAEQARIAYEQKLAEEAYAKAQIAKSLSMQQTQELLKQSVPTNAEQASQNLYTPSTIPTSKPVPTATKSSVAPLVAGIGLLALIGLTGGGGSQ